MPDATLEEFLEQLKKKARVNASITTIWRALRNLGVLAQKKSIWAIEADPIKRAKFKKRQRRLPVERLVFIDEFGVDTTMTRSHAWSLKGERAESIEPFKPRKKISVIGALSLTGVGATMSVEGSVDTEVFDAYVQHLLVPTLFWSLLLTLSEYFSDVL